MIPYQIISSGSNGNAVVLNNNVLVDCGVPFKDVEPYEKDLQLVLLTHKHSDHFRKSTIMRLANDKPLLRFGCGSWMVNMLLDAGVKANKIDVLKHGFMYAYSSCNVIPVYLTHDVPNCGYKIHFGGQKVFYATDAANLNGIDAKGYDLYLVEANHITEEIDNVISEKRADGMFSYEMRAKKYHLSKEQCDDFLYKNMKQDSAYIYMHQHRG